MENILFSFQLVAIIVFVGCIIWILFSDKEKNKYRKISFKDKKEYLCVYYLYGNKDMKSNIGVFSKKGDTYLLETEDRVKIYTFSFSKEDILKIEVKEKSGIGMGDTVVDHEYDHTKAYFSGHGATTFVEEKTIKVKRFYDIKITLTNGIILTLESNKDPKNFFRDIH